MSIMGTKRVESQGKAITMNSDYVDNWDALPESLQVELAPIIAQFDAGADLLFDRRLNLSFEAAVKDLSIPGVVALTEGLRALRDLLLARVTVADAASGELLFDSANLLTAYDLPLYTPCVYISQLAQFMDGQNVRVWKESTAEEIVEILCVMARYVRPDIETARTLTAALQDMVYLYPQTLLAVEKSALYSAYPNEMAIAKAADTSPSHKNGGVRYV